MTATMVESTHDTDAEALVELYDRMRAINRINAARADDPALRLTGADLDAALTASTKLEAACEEFRRKHYPHAKSVICAGGMVIAFSPKGKRGRIVYEAKR